MAQSHGTEQFLTVCDAIAYLSVCSTLLTGATANDVIAASEAEQPPSRSLARTSTTSTTATTNITPAHDYRIKHNQLDVNTASRPHRPSLRDRRPAPTIPFDLAVTRQRLRPPTTSVLPPTRRRWPPRRGGRYPPNRYRYGRRPPYRSATEYHAVSTLLTVLTFLVAMAV